MLLHINLSLQVIRRFSVIPLQLNKNVHVNAIANKLTNVQEILLPLITYLEEHRLNVSILHLASVMVIH